MRCKGLTFALILTPASSIPGFTHLVQRPEIMLVPLGQAAQPVLIADGLLEQVRRDGHDGHQRVVLEVGGGLLCSWGRGQDEGG